MKPEEEINGFIRLVDTIIEIRKERAVYNLIMDKADEIEKLEKKLDILRTQQRTRLNKILGKEEL